MRCTSCARTIAAMNEDLVVKNDFGTFCTERCYREWREDQGLPEFWPEAPKEQ